jgi:hypothetical protein
MGESCNMMKTIVLSAALAVGIATAAGATIVPTPAGKADDLVTRVKEGCGPGMWRGPGGRCHPMFDGRACPPGYHLGPNRRRCHPN